MLVIRDSLACKSVIVVSLIMGNRGMSEEIGDMMGIRDKVHY